MARKKKSDIDTITETSADVGNKTKVRLTVSCVSLPHDAIYPDKNGYAKVTAEQLAILSDMGVVADEQ